MFDRLLQFSARERDEFARIVNRLLSTTFVVKRSEDGKRDYYFIERHEELIREYLSLAGWELLSDRTLGVYGVSNAHFNRQRLTLDESILLLLLRLSYEEKRKELQLTENVILRVRELQEKFAALKIRTKPIEKKTIREALALFKRFNLIELRGEATDPETLLELYPSLVLAVRVDDIRSAYERVRAYQEAATTEEEELA